MVSFFQRYIHMYLWYSSLSSLLFILIFIKSHIMFLHIQFVLHILLFYCFALFFILLHILLLISFFLPIYIYIYIYSCVVLLLYNKILTLFFIFLFYFFYSLHCPLSGPDLTYISLLIIPCIIYHVTNKETLNLEPWYKNPCAAFYFETCIAHVSTKYEPFGKSSYLCRSVLI